MQFSDRSCSIKTEKDRADYFGRYLASVSSVMGGSFMNLNYFLWSMAWYGPIGDLTGY
ncbi:MAG: hypothetical protein ACE3L7_13830 [Candidatus Pristimantibacillus sp.]